MKIRTVAALISVAAAIAFSSSVRAKQTAPSQEAQSSAEPTQSVWDGVYTEEQASRGEALYAQKCARCHGQDLTGGEIAPALNSGEFKSNWSGLSVDDLFERIKVSMPQDNPGSLSRQQTADAVAFVLSRNGFPAGKTELAREAEVVKTIRFEENKPEVADARQRAMPPEAVTIGVTAGAPAKDACDLPPGLQRAIAAKYPGAGPVTLTALNADDKGLFQKDHGDACPGLVKVDFYGDGKPTLALVLIAKGEMKEKSKLVVAHQVSGQWKTVLLDSADGAPVVWTLPPGQYRDVYGEKEIRATRTVIVFAGYESWSILYAWTGSRVTRIWLQD